MKFPPIPFVLGRVRPVKLERAISTMGLSRGANGHAQKIPSEADINEARRLLAFATSGGRIPPASRRVRKSVLRIAVTELKPVESESDRAMFWAASQMIVDGGGGRRELFELWQHTPFDDQHLFRALGTRILAFLRRSSRAKKRIPDWLLGGGNIVDVLARPEPYFRRYCEEHQVDVSTLHDRLGFPISTPRGHEIVVGLILMGMPRWWRQQPMNRVLSWASGRSLAIIRAVAQRQLEELADQWAHVGREDRDALKRWVLGALGDPESRPGSWEGVSSRARDTFERLLVDAELARILDEFRRSAEDARAKYWSAFEEQFIDAHLLDVKGTAVCLLVLRDVLIVEFGTTGNACYFYRAPGVRCRTMFAGRRMNISDFKNKAGLPFQGGTARYLRKLSHSSRWQANYDDYLRTQHGIEIPWRIYT